MHDKSGSSEQDHAMPEGDVSSGLGLEGPDHEPNPVLDDPKALAQRLARQLFEQQSLSAHPPIAQVELLCEILGVLQEVRGLVEDVAENVQKEVAGSGQEGVMGDVNATLLQRDRAGLGAGPLGGFEADQDGAGGVLTTAEVASLLRVDPKTISRWLAAGEMPAPIAIKGVRRWRRSVIEAWLLEQEGSE